MALVSLAKLAEASETNCSTIGNLAKELREAESARGWTVPLDVTRLDRYPAGMKATVLGIAEELMSLGFKQRTTVLIISDLCDGVLKLGTIQRWVYSLRRRPPEVRACTEACREHGERCTSRIKHARIHFHLAKGATHHTPIGRRGAHFWDTLLSAGCGMRRA